MNPNGYTRLGESERRLFRVAVQDIMDIPLVSGAYRYNESVIVVSADGTYRCLEVWGNNDYTTTVGMVAGLSTPPRTWLPLPMAEQTRRPPHDRFNFDSFPISIVLYEWTSLDESPPFVRWSGAALGVPSGALRRDVSRITVNPIMGTCLLYAPGMVSPPSSFRDPTTVASTADSSSGTRPGRPLAEGPVTIGPARPGPSGPSARGPGFLVALIGGSILAVALLVFVLVKSVRPAANRYEGAYIKRN
jgi:hypothetical protein